MWPGEERLAALRLLRDTYVAELAKCRFAWRRAELHDFIGRIEGSIAAELTQVFHVARSVA